MIAYKMKLPVSLHLVLLAFLAASSVPAAHATRRAFAAPDEQDPAAPQPAWRGTLAAALCDPANRGGRLLIVTASASAAPPARRAAGAPAAALLPAPGNTPAARAAVAVANRLLLAAEGTLMGGRRAFPTFVIFSDLRAAAASELARGCGGGGGPGGAASDTAGDAGRVTLPYALFDAATSQLVVDAAALAPLAAVMSVTEQAAAVGRLAEVAVDALGGAVQQVMMGQGVDALAVERAVLCALTPKQQQPKPQTTQVVASFSASQTSLSSAALPALAAAAAAAIPAALSAAAGGGLLGGAAAAAGGAVTTSVWFCIACVASLGLLAPLAVNYVIGAFRFNPEHATPAPPSPATGNRPTKPPTDEPKQTAPPPRRGRRACLREAEPRLGRLHGPLCRRAWGGDGAVAALRCPHLQGLPAV